jgi:hypothetical protein
MPAVAFDSLPRHARVWVFAADTVLNASAEAALLREVDGFLAEWNAHGHPLTCARAWRDGRFLAIGVDQSTAGASGCSIDGLFRVLQRLQPELGANLLPGPRIFWRGADGVIASTVRSEFSRLASSGAVSAATPVFDTSLTTAADWRERFERPAGESWHGALLGATATGARAHE